MCDVTCALDGFSKVDLYRWSCTCYVKVKVVPLIDEHVFNWIRCTCICELKYVFSSTFFAADLCGF